jgi:hypothetical protein
MKLFNYKLITDGSSDVVFVPILSWLLRIYLSDCKIEDQAAWVDFRALRKPPDTLVERVKWVQLFATCDLLFVHRDAEKQSLESRTAEIQQALAQAEYKLPTICVIPVKMQEAWLLFDETALRSAASNPNGKTRLALPLLTQIEQIPDPKKVLHTLLEQASGLHGRRLEQFSAPKAAHRVPDFIDDFSPLRQLSAFQALEAELKTVLSDNGWLNTEQ